MGYIFTEYALEDIIKYALQYDNKQVGLGLRFMEEVFQTAKDILKSPKGYINLFRNTRECRTKIFPYKLIYTIEEKVIYIHAIYPCKANPKKKYKNVKR